MPWAPICRQSQAQVGSARASYQLLESYVRRRDNLLRLKILGADSGLLRAQGRSGKCFVSKAEFSYTASERGRTRCRESSCTKSLLRGKYLGNFLATNGSAQSKRPLKTSLSHFLHPLLKCR